MNKLRKACVIGNWKMYGSKAMISEFVAHFSHSKLLDPTVEHAICPPYPYLQAFLTEIKANDLVLQLGAQNVHSHGEGAFTGEISASMLVEMGCRYVIIGHSERRQLFFESDPLIASKFVAAYHAGLIPIVCVGETQAERNEGKTYEVVTRQLQAVWERAPAGAFAKSLIAYEPVWAIGTGLSATPDQAEDVHAYLRQWLADRDEQTAQNVRILYGGSVKSNNAEALFAQPNIDGALIGGASLHAQEFLNICKIAIARD